MHPLARTLRIWLREIYDPRYMPWPRRRQLALGAWRKLHADEEGKLTFATIFAVLALIVMIGFVGNSGHAVEEKIELQNAADAAAYSSALWMARGMNAVTATNHLLGELTALCVVHEALGGPELDAYHKDGWDAENKHPTVGMLNNTIRQFGNENIGPVTNKSPYWPMVNAMHTPDAKLVKFAVDQVAPKNEKFYSGATIFDAKINLKRELTTNLMAKSFANLGYFVPPMIGPIPVGVITAAAATAVHLYASAQIALIIKEWILLKALEKAAIFIAPLKIKIEEQGIPTLAKFSGYAATGKGGSTSGGGGGGAGKSLVAKRIDAALLDLGRRHNATLAVFPTSRTLQLPIEPEPAPQLSGQADWGDEEPAEIDPALLDRLTKMQSDMNEREREGTETRSDQLDDIETLNEREEELVKKKKELEEKQKKEKEAADKMKEEDPTSQPKPPDPKIQAEIDEINKELAILRPRRSQLIKKTRIQNVDEETKQKTDIPAGGLKPLSEEQRKANGQLKGRAEIQWQIDQLERQQQQIKATLDNKDIELTAEDRTRLETLQSHVQTMLADRRGELKYAVEDPQKQMREVLTKSGGNPTLANLRQIKVDAANLRYSQWVRATYPYVDAFRSGVTSMFESQLSKSKAAKSFRRYCDHFAMVKSLQFRTGYGWQKQGAAPQLSWQKLPKREALTMYVMKKMYVGKQPRKGHEPWVQNERMAEQYFTVIGFAYRPSQESLFAPSVFRNAHPRGKVAHAQAMLYNANEQEPASETPGAVQANVGWDTLNWAPPVTAYEQGGGESKTGAKWPWELFNGGAVKSDRARVKLNWQAKLIPVTGTRMDEARQESRLPRGVRDVLKKTKKHFGEVITH